MMKFLEKENLAMKQVLADSIYTFTTILVLWNYVVLPYTKCFSRFSNNVFW